jgi:mRNA-degrading endonuclease RelE of RelBE toxin-antitoxin system
LWIKLRPDDGGRTPRVAKEAVRLLGERSHRQLIEFLGLNPNAGVVIPGTGGVRKLRWAVPGRGKSGGARVVYYFHDENLPILALGIYAKNQKIDITGEDRKQMKAAIHEYIGFYKGSSRGKQ